MTLWSEPTASLAVVSGVGDVGAATARRTLYLEAHHVPQRVQAAIDSVVRDLHPTPIARIAEILGQDAMDDIDAFRERAQKETDTATASANELRKRVTVLETALNMTKQDVAVHKGRSEELMNENYALQEDLALLREEYEMEAKQLKERVATLSRENTELQDELLYGDGEDDDGDDPWAPPPSSVAGKKKAEAEQNRQKILGLLAGDPKAIAMLAGIDVSGDDDAPAPAAPEPAPAAAAAADSGAGVGGAQQGGGSQQRRRSSAALLDSMSPGELLRKQQQYESSMSAQPTASHKAHGIAKAAAAAHANESAARWAKRAQAAYKVQSEYRNYRKSQTEGSKGVSKGGRGSIARQPSVASPRTPQPPPKPKPKEPEPEEKGLFDDDDEDEASAAAAYGADAESASAAAREAAAFARYGF